MKTVNSQANTYQRQQFLQFFNQLQGLPPFRKQFADRNFRQLLFFTVVNAIQETKRGPWIIQIAVAEHLMKDIYPFDLPPSFFTYSNAINLDVKLSIIQTLSINLKNDVILFKQISKEKLFMSFRIYSSTKLLRKILFKLKI